MRKKYLSALLFGALLVASAGTFTSCKDYDDDINSLKEQVDSQASLTNTLSEQIKALETAAKAAQTSADDALAAAKAASDAAKAAQAAGDEAKAAAETAKAEAEAAKAAAATAKVEAIAEAQKMVEDLKAEIAEGYATVDQLNSEIKKVNTAISVIEEGLNAEIERLDGAIEGLDLRVEKAESAIEELKLQMAAVEAYKELIDANSLAIESNTEAINKLIKDLADAKAELEEAIADVAGDLSSLDSKVNTIKSDLEKKISDLNSNLITLIGQTLTSLVYVPGLYVNGIEATEYDWMDYTTLKSVTLPGEEWQFTDEEGVKCVVTTSSEEWNYSDDKAAEYNPIIFVNYNVNPSHAVIEQEWLKLISADAEVVNTRASESAPYIVPAEEQKIVYKDGILSVPVRVQGSKIKTNGTESTDPVLSEASIFALQATVPVSADSEETRVVTSDYASLYSSTVTPQAIAYDTKEYNGFTIDAVNCQYGNDELFKTVDDAFSHAPTLKVAYDSQVDLKELLEIHYDHNSLTSKNGEHKVWNWGEEAKYGLKYDFALIEYKAGDNVTEDSKYVDQELALEGVIAPRKVNANGTTSNETGISSVGRHPLVRVRVLDSNNKVVLHAYVKLEIVQSVENSVTEVFDKKDVKFGCQDCVKTLTWAEISDQLLEKAKVSKEQFEQLYKVDTYENGDLKQFYEKGDNSFAECTGLQIYGVVTEKAEGQGVTNSVLEWTLDQVEQQRIYLLDNSEKKIYVRYVRIADNPEGTSDVAPIYLPIRVNVTKPQGNVTTKIDKYWYNNSQNTRLNVNYPKDGGDTKEFVVDLNQVWVGNKPMFNPTEGYESYTEDAFATQFGSEGKGGYKYYFASVDYEQLTDQNGTKYTIFAGQNKKSVEMAEALLGKSYEVTPENELKHALLANTGVYNNTSLYAQSGSTIEEIATINQATGEITYNNNSDFAKKLLNAYDHSEAKLFAQIGIVAYTNCSVAMSLKDSNYPAYFLRPISIDDNATGTFYDAQANGSTINIAEVFDFTDWRDVSFKKDSDYKNVWLYAYYNITNVKVDIKGVTTNLNGGSLGTDNTTNGGTKLSSITDKIVLTQEGGSNIDLSNYNASSAGNQTTWNAIVTAMGKVKYVNNGNNVQEFKLRIPVEFTYDWGVIKSYVDVTVKNTMGN